TARNSEIVRIRAAELGLTLVRQGFEDKWPAALEMMQQCGVSPEQCAYIGDDLPDIPVMRRVALAACPCDAAQDTLDAAHWILRRGGGQGCVRELLERLLRATGRWEGNAESI
ncbi:MAG: HAD family hydrolase, partial [Planctomycetota bacterium]